MVLSPTFANIDEDKVVLEVLAKINKCERVYEPVEPELRYIKLLGVSEIQTFQLVLLSFECNTVLFS